MKKIILMILISISLGSCNQPNKDTVISAKFYLKDRPCICEFYYGQQTFHDSCNMYHVGDKLIVDSTKLYNDLYTQYWKLYDSMVLLNIENVKLQDSIDILINH